MNPSGTRDSLARAGIGAFVAGVLSVVLGFTSSIVVSRALGPSGKGAYDLGLASAALLSLVLGISLPSGITYAVARGLTPARPLLPRLSLFAAAQAAGALVVLVGILISPVRSAVLPAGLGAPAVAPIGIIVGLTSLSALARGILVGLERILSANMRDLAGRVATVLLLIGAVVAIDASHGQPTAIALLWVTAVGSVVGAGLQVGGVLRSAKPSSDPPVLGPAVRYAVPAYFGNVVQFLNYRLDQFLVAYFVGTTELGTYALAVTLGQLIWLMSNVIAQVLLPRVASEDRHGEAGDVAARMTRITLALSLAGAIILGFVAGLLIPIVYGTRFTPAVGPLLWLLPGIVAFGAVNVLAAYIGGRGRPDLNLAVAAVGLLVTLALDLALIPRFGGVGAAIASTVSYSISAVLTLTIARRLGGFSVRELVLLTPGDVSDAVRATRSIMSSR